MINREQVLIEVLMVAHVLSLCGKLTPDVARALNLLLSRLELPPVIPEWRRQNGKHVTATLELPAITEVQSDLS